MVFPFLPMTCKGTSLTRTGSPDFRAANLAATAAEDK